MVLEEVERAGHFVDDVEHGLARTFRIALRYRVGDRIVRVAGETTRHRVLRLEDHAHYAGRPWHRWAIFGKEDA